MKIFTKEQTEIQELLLQVLESKNTPEFNTQLFNNFFTGDTACGSLACVAGTLFIELYPEYEGLALDEGRLPSYADNKFIDFLYKADSGELLGFRIFGFLEKSKFHVDVFGTRKCGTIQERIDYVKEQMGG